MPPLKNPSRGRAGVVGIVAAVMVLLVFLHVPGVNGTWYWKWMWIRLPAGEIVPGILLAALPGLLGVWMYERRVPAGVGLGCVMLSVLLMQFACARRRDDPLALERVTHVVAGGVSNSYFRSAGRLLAEGATTQPRWLGTYPGYMHDLFLHARNKPPGLVLVYMPMIERLGYNELAAMVSGLYMAALTPLCVPAVYWMLWVVTRDRKAAFHGAALLAFTPALVLLFPTWDQVFPVFTAGMVGLWVVAVDRKKWGWALLFGIWLGIATFFTFNPLVLGVFLAGYAIVQFWLTPTRAMQWRLIRLIACALAGVIGFYFILHWITGYDPIATLRTGMANQRELERTLLKRPYPATIPFDVLDFLMGAGWIGAVVIGFYVRDRIVARELRSRGFLLTLLVIAQMVILAVTGLLTVETARVWIFLMPLFMVPVSLEIARWTAKERRVIYLALLAVVISLTLNMRFLAT